jgi:PIH1 CS-like domain
MPAEVSSVKEIEADIKNRRLVVSSPKYFLDMYLPQPPTANPNSHVAKWDSNKKQLVVQVKLEREFDYVNF